MQRLLSGVYITELSYSSWIHIRMLTLPLVLVESFVACLKTEKGGDFKHKKSKYFCFRKKPFDKSSKIPLSVNNQQKLSVLISVPQLTQSDSLVCQTLPYISLYLLVQKKRRGIPVGSCTSNTHTRTFICIIIFLSSPIGDSNLWLFSNSK